MFGAAPARVAIISNSHVVREGLVSLIARLGDRTVVVDVASTGGQLPDADVVIYDLAAAEDLSRLSSLREESDQGMPVIGLVYDKDRAFGALRTEGSDSIQIVDLAVTPDELATLIEKIALRDDGTRRRPRVPLLPAGLTERELQVLTLIGQGLSNKDIAIEMYVTENTVKTYIRTAYGRIKAKSRPKAILWALEHGLVARPEHDSAPNAFGGLEQRREQ
jgi:DNA-binding NarL/FixJ family response regulator